MEWFAGVPGVESIEVGDGGLALHLAVREDMGAVLKVAAQHDAVALTSHEPSLEEVFLRFYEPAPVAQAPREPVAAGER
jgi:ABC-2 type transport system ATP-binding protein